MVKRKLEDLNLLDDFLFTSVVNYPDIGEKFIRELLKVILGKEIGKLTVIPQKVYPGSDTDKHGARLDVYIEKNCADEVPTMPYDDGSRTIFLYTKGTEGIPSEELEKFLHYMEHTTEENAVTDNLRNINQMVNLVKQDEEVSLQYMKIFEREEMLIQQGIQQGREEERINTEREHQRAEKEKARAEQLEKELQQLKEQLAQFKS
ncbi:MAG: hypothetical protein ACI4DZ_05880 [Oliverpabstia sp.]